MFRQGDRYGAIDPLEIGIQGALKLHWWLADLSVTDFSNVAGDAEKGRLLFSDKGCVGCHGAGGSGSTLAPRSVGIFGGKETLADNTQVTVDTAYLVESIKSPSTKVVKGFPPIMPPFAQLSDAEILNLLAYIASLTPPSITPTPAPPTPTPAPPPPPTPTPQAVQAKTYFAGE